MTALPRIDERYDTLLEVNRVAITQDAPESIFQGMCTALKKVFPYDRAGLMLYQPEEDALKIVALHGTVPGSFFRIGTLLKTKESPHGLAFMNQRIVLRGNIETERQFAVEEFTLSEGLRSYCAVPLVRGGPVEEVLLFLGSEKDSSARRKANFCGKPCTRSCWPGKRL